MAHSSLITSDYEEPRTPPLRSRRRRRKEGRRGDTISSSSSGLTMDTMPASLNTLPVSVPMFVKGNRRDRPAECSSAASRHCNTSFPSSVLLLPSTGLKLGHMLSLIKQDDVEFKHHAHCSQICFPSKKVGPRMMLPLKSRRLRGLIALAHHLDEEDCLSRVPASVLPESFQPPTPIPNVAAIPSTA